MMRHEVTTEELLVYAAGRTGPEVSAAIEAHLSGCPDCAALVERARTIAGVLREEQSLMADPPADLARAAKDLFARIRPDLVAAAAPEGLESLRHAVEAVASIRGLRRILAELTFDSLTSAATIGLRSAASKSRHLAYQSELADLDLQIVPPSRPLQRDARWQLMGQVEFSDPPSGAVPLVFLRSDASVLDDAPLATEASERIATSLDSRGYFTVELPAGTWAACMAIGEAVLVFPGIDI